ncbi:hypothetical protein FOZ62_006731 [Perkinsus olseni]|uniref:Uncharacterized protein n=1 Tax=Perkinsus olseni TaxID=32597 RepID=A0A7J6S6W2_PEROL|nr:hypothetical protein FOZ62_006731 [Perkinsus olseni]
MPFSNYRRPKCGYHSYGPYWNDYHGYGSWYGNHKPNDQNYYNSDNGYYDYDNNYYKDYDTNYYKDYGANYYKDYDNYNTHYKDYYDNRWDDPARRHSYYSGNYHKKYGDDEDGSDWPSTMRDGTVSTSTTTTTTTTTTRATRRYDNSGTALGQVSPPIDGKGDAAKTDNDSETTDDGTPQSEASPDPSTTRSRDNTDTEAALPKDATSKPTMTLALKDPSEARDVKQKAAGTREDNRIAAKDTAADQKPSWARVRPPAKAQPEAPDIL